MSLVFTRRGGSRGGVVTNGDFVTNFPAVESPISQGGIWQRGLAEGLDWNNPQTTSNGAMAIVQSGLGATRYDDSIAHLTTAYRTFANNQYAQGTVYLAPGYTGSGGAHELELLLRFSISAHDAHGYEILWGISGYIAVVKWLGGLGSFTPLYDPGAGSIPVYADGDTLKASIVGNTLTVLRNGASINSTLDAFDLTVGSTVSMWDSGQPGIGFWPIDGGTPTSAGWKAYSAGNL